MADWFGEMAGPGYATAMMWTLGALVLLLVVLVLIKIVRGLTFGTFVVGGRNRRTRLAVMDATAVDSQRRLVLVRRDDVEHLLLIGGASDLVIESDIRAGVPAFETPREEPRPSTPRTEPRPQIMVAEARQPAQTTRPPAPRPVAPAAPPVSAPSQPTPRPAPPVAAAPEPVVREPRVPEPRVDSRPAQAPSRGPAAFAARPDEPQRAPVAPVVAPPVAATAAPRAPIDDDLISELEATLDDDLTAVPPVSGTRAEAPAVQSPTRQQDPRAADSFPELDDEMEALLGELTAPRRN